jgi:4-oxalocrotonate tautomerase
MPIVSIKQGPRDVAQKRALVSEITDAFVHAYGIPAETVQVWFTEFDNDSWGHSGKLAAD